MLQTACLRNKQKKSSDLKPFKMLPICELQWIRDFINWHSQPIEIQTRFTQLGKKMETGNVSTTERL